MARYILLIALALFLQTSWVHKLSIFEVRPDVILLVLVYIGITSGQIQATLFGFFSGFLLDIYQDPQSMGINALVNSLVGFAVGYSRVGVVAEDIQVQALILFLAGILHDTIFFALSDPADLFSLMLRRGVGTACYTACLGVGLSLLWSVRFDRGTRLNA